MSNESNKCLYCGRDKASLWGDPGHVALYHDPLAKPSERRLGIAVVEGVLVGGALGFLIPIIVLSSGDVGMALYFAACQGGGCAALVVAIFGGATAAGALLGALIAAALAQR